MSSWSSCSSSCGSGKQVREATCYEASSGRIVEEGLCNDIQAPTRERLCHVHSCELNMLDFRRRVVPQKTCGDKCSVDFEESTLLCVAVPTGYLSASDLCEPLMLGNIQALPKFSPLRIFAAREEQKISSVRCLYVLGLSVEDRSLERMQQDMRKRKDASRSVCNECSLDRLIAAKRCVIYRMCVDWRDDARVDDSNCNVSSRPKLTRVCNSRPCDAYIWRVEKWSACDQLCDSGGCRSSFRAVSFLLSFRDNGKEGAVCVR